jgi:hypothetical protein
LCTDVTRYPSGSGSDPGVKELRGIVWRVA